MSKARSDHRSSAIWLGVLFAVLAGLFGMHGLSTHGADLHGHEAMAVSADPVAELGAHAEHAGDPARPSSAAPVLERTGAPTGDPGAMHGLALCLALLASSLLALGALLMRQRAHPAAPSLLARRRPRFTVTARQHAPPSLAELSILRC